MDLDTSSRRYYDARYGELKAERQSFIPHWRDLSDHILTRQSRFLATDRNRGDRRNNKIIDNTATLALRTLASGMLTGLASPSRPWLALRTPDPDLNEYQPVKLWLDLTRNRMLEVFLRSNLYTTLPLSFADLGCYGTSAFAALPDYESLLRFYHFPIGSYSIANSDRGTVDTCYREFMMTVRQLLMMFREGAVSKAVNNLANAKSLESWVNVTHAVEPNPDFNPQRAQWSNYKAFRSVYYEPGSNEEKMLRVAGFDRMPVLASRWKITGEDVYGNSPGMEILGDVRALQLQQKRKQQLIDKGVNPAMSGPSSMREGRSSVLPGDVTWYDQPSGGQKFEPVYRPEPAYYQWLLQDIAETQGRIKRGLFEDLFLLLANDTRSNVTAREVAERHEEKLLLLGPVVEQQNDDLFDPLVDIAFDAMLNARILPKPPPELQGQSINVEYISIMAQAMKLVGLPSIERTIGFIAQLGQAKPEAFDWINVRETIAAYRSMSGAPPKIINDAKVVEAIAAGRAQQQKMMQLAAAAKPAADAAGAVKDLADANTSGNNALTQIAARLQGRPPPAGQAKAA